MMNYLEELSPNVDDFSGYEKAWTHNRMIADGANFNSEQFKAGASYAKADVLALARDAFLNNDKQNLTLLLNYYFRMEG